MRFEIIRSVQYLKIAQTSECCIETDSADDMATDKPTVLILGGTGYTGQSIVDGLLKSGNFVRAQPQSAAQALNAGSCR